MGASASSTLRRGTVFFAVLAGALLTGCPRSSGQLDLASLPSITTSDPEAEADLRAARESADAGRSEEAEERFRAFLRAHPADPLVPVARLGLGRVLLAEMHIEAALEELESVAASDDERVAEAGRFYRGVAFQLAGRHEEALTELGPLVGRTTDPEETELLLRTLASAAQRTGRAVLALDSLDRLARAEAVDEDVRGRARDDIRALVAAAEPGAVQEAYAELPRDGVAWPEVAVRAIRLAFDAGDMTRVSEMVADLRARDLPMSEELAELAVRAERTGRADPRVIGAIVPLTGNARAVGQRAVRGLMLASGSPPTGPPGPDTPQLVMRDDGGDPERAAAAVEDLVSEHRAIAIIGPLEGASARAAARRAQELGVPIVTLVPDPRVAESGPMVFRLFPGPEEEVRALVEAARRRGARRFAVLRPDHAYGRRMSEAFASAVAAAGGELVHTETYPATATAFGEPIGRLARHRPEALFIPDDGARLTLVAPALAAAGLWSVRAGARPARGGQAITILAPSVALDAPRRGSSRYLQGALFAAPFHPAGASGAGQAFIDAFTTRFSEAPDTFAAHSYDAFRLIRRAVEAGETTRAGVARWLTEHGRQETVTAGGGLGPDRGPAGRSRVLELVGEALAPLAAGTS